MNIRTFKAKSLQEGLNKIREEFGENARIMHTRQIDERSFFGLRKRRLVEITAAEDAENIEKIRENVPAAQSSPQPSPPLSFDSGMLDTAPISDYGYGKSVVLKDDDQGISFLSSQTMPQTLSPHVPRYDFSFNASWKSVPQGKWRCLTPEQLNPTLLQRSVIAKLGDFVRFGGPFELKSGRRHIAAFLGTTGVGKTSMIAKIAAHYKLKEFKKVGLLTIDMFRIAATEQLQKYAEMLELPFETVSEPLRMPAALRRLENCDLVLLDTPGTNPKNDTKLRMLAEALRTAKTDSVQLLLSATGSLAVLKDSLQRFDFLRPDSLGLTKLDEAVGLADLYPFLKDNHLPLGFLSMGQNISEDIEVAGPARLASLV